MTDIVNTWKEVAQRLYFLQNPANAGYVAETLRWLEQYDFKLFKKRTIDYVRSKRQITVSIRLKGSRGQWQTTTFPATATVAELRDFLVNVTNIIPQRLQLYQIVDNIPKSLTDLDDPLEEKVTASHLFEFYPLIVDDTDQPSSVRVNDLVDPVIDGSLFAFLELTLGQRPKLFQLKRSEEELFNWGYEAAVKQNGRPLNVNEAYQLLSDKGKIAKLPSQPVPQTGQASMQISPVFAATNAPQIEESGPTGMQISPVFRSLSPPSEITLSPRGLEARASAKKKSQPRTESKRQVSKVRSPSPRSPSPRSPSSKGSPSPKASPQSPSSSKGSPSPKASPRSPSPKPAPSRSKVSKPSAKSKPAVKVRSPSPPKQVPSAPVKPSRKSRWDVGKPSSPLPYQPKSSSPALVQS